MSRTHILNFLKRNQITLQSRPLSYYITTPIFYANASPHIGHVHTLLLADALNIYNRLKVDNDDTIFSTGTDEHGIKVQTAAKASNSTCQAFCDLNAERFKELFRQYDTTATDFIRTTEERHKKAVQSMWSQLESNGFIYKSTYEGWYCTTDEVFVPESQVKSKLVNGQTIHEDQNENPVVWSREENYMFRMSEFQDDIKSWLSRDKPVVPEKFNDLVIHTLDHSRLGDISISRPKSRLEWGIQVPGDSNQTIYVWLDALASYLTVAGYPCGRDSLRRWPVDCHVIGKDIVKFHAIYWPAFLLALSLPLPKKLLCHSHWTIDSLKMSKSRGNVVNPWEENSILSSEGLRYYLLRASTTHSDTSYSRQQALRRVNAELADTYGNLFSRSSSKIINPNQVIPKNLIETSSTSQIPEMLDSLRGLASICEQHYENADFYMAVDEIMAILRLNNKIYEDTQPWRLVKTLANNPEARRTHHNLQAITFETLRVCSILLQPIIPNLSNKALSFMGIRERSWNDAKVTLNYGNQNDTLGLTSSDNFVLFKRIK